MTQSRIEQLLASYLRSVDADVTLTMVGRTPYVDLQYVDFKPEEVVRKQLRALIPNIQWLRLERTYSPSAVMSELKRMYQEDMQLMVEVEGGLFRPTLLPILVQERMIDREFTQTQ